jgi:putative intracellular protease/amidase
MSPQHPTHIAVVLFPGFQLLDVTGPLDALNMLSQTHTLRLSILAASLSPISTAVSVQSGSGSAFAQSLVPTHTFAAPPAGIEVLIVPGGLGCREESIRGPVVEFLRGLGLNEGARKSEGAWGEGQLKWVLTVCTGSMIVAETGALDGRRATTNKKAFNEVRGSSLISFVPSLLVPLVAVC